MRQASGGSAATSTAGHEQHSDAPHCGLSASFGMVQRFGQVHACTQLRLERKNWQAGTVPTAKQRRERQVRTVISQRRLCRRQNGMSTLHGLKIESSLFIGRWTPKVLFSLDEKPYRHGQLRRRLGSVSQRMLTRTLRNLESTGLIERRVTGSKPMAVEYSLTRLGRTIITPLGGMCRWARRPRPERDCGVSLPEVRSQARTN
jgi:DNA-binding HxlR family transcriptional regulator